jgi:hypothetical protein
MVRALARGTCSITASLDGVTGSTLLTVTPPQIPGPPCVTGIVGVKHLRSGIMSITVAFSKALNAASATKRAFYGLALGVKKKNSVVFSKNLRIAGVTYDASDYWVTIWLAKPTKGKIRVTVRSGIKAADGTVSSSAFTTVVS